MDLEHVISGISWVQFEGGENVSSRVEVMLVYHCESEGPGSHPSRIRGSSDKMSLVVRSSALEQKQSHSHHKRCGETSSLETQHSTLEQILVLSLSLIHI